MIDLQLMFSVGLGAVNLLIALYVYLRAPQRLVNKVFTGAAAAIALWTIAIGFAHSPMTSTLFLARATFAAGALAFIALPALFLVFPSSSSFPRSRLYYGFATGGCALLGLALVTPLIVRKVERISP